MEPPLIPAIYLQVLAIGLPWTLAHCAGMCGPILLGLRFGARGGSPPAAGAALADLAVYQASRLAVYAAAGAAVGSVGSVIAGWRWGLAVLATVAALGFLLAAARRIPAIARHLATRASTSGPLAHRLGALARLRERRPLLGAALIGSLLAGLPCGIAAWALALAAATASPLHGAAVMALVVAMSSLPLAATVLAPVAAHRFGFRAPVWLVPTCLVVSAGLMLALAIGAATAHPSCPFCAAAHG